jgi:hypothetical protein
VTRYTVTHMPIVICANCNGTGKGNAHIHVNRGSYEHKWLRQICGQCRGSGKDKVRTDESIKAGISFRKERIARGERIFDTAARLGISCADVSAIDRGNAVLEEISE